MMQVKTVMTIRDQALVRIGERAPITVSCGEMFAKNLWREFDLPHINRIALNEAVDALCKEGLVSVVEGSIRRDSAQDAGVVRSRSTTRERIYTLTASGERAYQSLLAERTDTP